MDLKNRIIGIIMIFFVIPLSIERNFLHFRLGMEFEEFKETEASKYEITSRVFHVPGERIFVVKLPSKYVVEVQCFFYKNRLYRFDVAYDPEPGFWKDLIKRFFERYKKPRFENPDACVWNDNHTELIVLKREYVVIYRDDRIADIIEKEEERMDPLNNLRR